jgi:tyrosine-protein phosphatase SIW14
MFSLLKRSGLLVIAILAPAFADTPAQGIKNFYQVDPEVFRGAQPTKDGFNYLASIGVKTVINLREDGKRSKTEEKEVTDAGMKYVSVPMTGLTAPTQAEIDRILSILEANSGPVFLHCKRGADRTGVAIASYRIDHDGWDNARALKEAMSKGMSLFQIPRQKYILAFRPRSSAATSTALTSGAASASEIAPQ